MVLLDKNLHLLAKEALLNYQPIYKNIKNIYKKNYMIIKKNMIKI